MSENQGRLEHVERIAKIIDPIAFNSSWAARDSQYDEETIKNDCLNRRADAMRKAEEILKYLARNKDKIFS